MSVSGGVEEKNKIHLFAEYSGVMLNGNSDGLCIHTIRLQNAFLQTLFVDNEPRISNKF